MSNREKRARKHRDENKLLRQVRKQIKPNRKPDRVRQKDWMAYATRHPEEPGEADLEQAERIMPLGERERRRSMLEAVTARQRRDDARPATDDTTSAAPGDVGQHGIVTEVSSGLCRVDLGDRALLCSLRGSLTAVESGFTNIVAVGDEVRVSMDGPGAGIVERIMPRRNALSRPDVLRGHLKQVLVANVDQLLVVAAWREPPIWLELIDRYLITAERNDITPIICVNKVDLAENRGPCHATLRPYLELGYRVLFTSAATGEGLDELRKVLRGKTTALAGMSGVGKSSLLAAVQPVLELRTASVSEASGEGRHTTTQVSLLSLGDDGFAIDTPGIREFGLSDVKRQELSRFYPEIMDLAEGCRFGDCSHLHEPGCAVRVAVQEGRLSADRYHSYGKIYESLPD